METERISEGNHQASSKAFHIYQIPFNISLGPKRNIWSYFFLYTSLSCLFCVHVCVSVYMFDKSFRSVKVYSNFYHYKLFLLIIISQSLWPNRKDFQIFIIHFWLFCIIQLMTCAHFNIFIFLTMFLPMKSV